MKTENANKLFNDTMIVTATILFLMPVQFLMSIRSAGMMLKTKKT